MLRVGLYDVRNELNSGKSIYDLPLKVTYYVHVFYTLVGEMKTS